MFSSVDYRVIAAILFLLLVVSVAASRFHAPGEASGPSVTSIAIDPGLPGAEPDQVQARVAPAPVDATGSRLDQLTGQVQALPRADTLLTGEPAGVSLDQRMALADARLGLNAVPPDRLPTTPTSGQERIHALRARLQALVDPAPDKVPVD